MWNNKHPLFFENGQGMISRTELLDMTGKQVNVSDYLSSIKCQRFKAFIQILYKSIVKSDVMFFELIPRAWRKPGFFSLGGPAMKTAVVKHRNKI